MTLTTMKYCITKAKAATNLVTNPKFELGTTGWTNYGTNTIAQSSTVSRRGVYSLKCTYADHAFLAAFTIDLTAATYVYSVDIYIPSDYDGTALSISFRFYTGGTLPGTNADMTIRDKWQRIEVTGTPVAGDLSGQIAVVESGTLPTAGKFIYIDGVQCELGSKATTFIDGDKVEVINGISQYGWNGTPNASTSYRRATTRSGGELIDIEDYMTITGMIGLGDTNRKMMKLPTANGYSIHQETRKSDREFILTGEVYGTAYGSWMEKRNQLISLLKPDAVNGDQPLIIRYQGYDATGAIATEPVDIKCRFVGGLGGEWKRPTNERISLIFEADDDIQKAADNGAALGYQTTISNANRVVRRDVNGNWSALQSVSLPTGSDVYKAIEGPNGKIYICGDYILAGGTGDSFVTTYDPNTDLFGASAFGVSPNSIVRDITFGADGKLYIVGDFTTVGGISANYIAVWNGSTWSALGSGLNARARTVYADRAGKIWVGGDFTTANGVTVNYLAYWNGTTFVAVGTGANGVVHTITGDNNNNIYVGGAFTTVNAVSAQRIAKIPSPYTTAVNIGNAGVTVVSTLMVDHLGILYAGGTFSSIGGVTVSGFAYYNGITWSNPGFTFDSATVSRIFQDEATKKIYVSGGFTTVNGYTLPDRCFEYVADGQFRPIDIDLPGSSTLHSVTTTKKGEIYITYLTTGTAYSATVTTPTVVGTRTYPKVKAVGPGTLWQIKNYTNNIAVYFNGFTLLSGETVTIDFEKGTINSTFRGSCMNYLLDGSSLNLNLEPGTNNISGYMTGTDANSKLTMTWKTRYNSLDEVML